MKTRFQPRREFLAGLLAGLSLSGQDQLRKRAEMIPPETGHVDVKVTWRHGTPLPVPKGGHASAVLGSKLIIAGGNNWEGDQKIWLSSVEAYDSATGVWRRLPSLPHPLAYAVGCSDQKAMYLIGGTDGDVGCKDAYRLIEREGKYLWSPFESLPEPRVYAAGTLLKNTLYVIGGARRGDDLKQTLNTVLRRKLADGSRWQIGAPLPSARAIFAAAACNGMIYVFGGCYADGDGNVVDLQDAHAYLPEQDRWTRIADLPHPIRGQTAAVYKNRYVFLAGGYTAVSQEPKTEPTLGFSSRILVYDAKSNTYLGVTPLPIRVMDSEARFIGSELYVVGGEDKGRHRTDMLAIGAVEARASFKTPGK